MPKHVLIVLLLTIAVSRAAEIKKVPMLDPDMSKAPAFDEANDAAKAFKISKSLKVSVFAAEPQLVSPVALTVDEKGKVYVIETFRAWGNGGIDMRKYMDWLDDDLGARTVQQRVDWITKRGGTSANNLKLDSDRVPLLEDKDGDGKADAVSVFSDGYHDIADGIAAGIMARKGEIYFANIPKLYSLKDTTGAGKADQKKVMFDGFGIHYQLIGHDLHGLKMGPDGRLYFSIGDRGAHVTTKEGKVLSNPDSGIVFRCDPDGSNLEMVATGLRNPQELAFDQYGNLFSADNNCDAGDMGRWVYIVDGGETGWRVGYQFITSPNNAGPWMSENLWRVENEHPAAWCLPPLGYACPGPSGIAYYPGTGLGDVYQNKFFVCDFRGSTNSGIWTFALKPRGAGFEVSERKQFFWNFLPTDLEFGPDGSMYVTDWVNGWFRPMKGRVWKVTNPDTAKSPLVLETAKLIGEGMEKRANDELIKLLGHADQRVRQEAQFELAGRGDVTLPLLIKRLSEENEQLARIHSMWALGQLGRKNPKALEPLQKLLEDGDSEIRAQAVKLLGDGKFAPAYDGLVRRLKDETSRVRFFAAMGLGKIGKKEALPKILDLLRENADKDVYIRHAGVMALLWINDKPSIESWAKDESTSVRLAALLVMRRQRDASIGRFLDDPHMPLADEAARAINDELIEDGLPNLATALARKNISRAVWFRAINANLRLGGAEQALALAKFAADETAPEDGRIEAMWALSNWATPPGRDRVMGLWRPIAARDAKFAVDVTAPVIEKIMMTGPPRVRVAAINLVEKIGVGRDLLTAVVMNKEAPPEARAAGLKAMESLRHANLPAAAKMAFEQGAGTPLRREAIGVYMRMPDAADRVGALFKGASLADQKAILEALGTAGAGVGDSILGQVMDTLLDGTMPVALQLDLLEAAEKSKSDAVAAKLKSFEARRDPKVPVTMYAETLEGGDAVKGKKIFFEKAATACLRCHKIGGEQEVVGPDLKGIAIKHDRKYLLESIVAPNAQITPGFQSLILKLKGNTTVGGVLKAETDKSITLIDPNEGAEVYEKTDIVTRAAGMSAMPEGLEKQLSKRELRDLMEFLAGLKDDKTITAEDAKTEGHGK